MGEYQHFPQLPLHGKHVSLGRWEPWFGKLGKNSLTTEQSDFYHFSIMCFSFHDYIQDVMIMKTEFLYFGITK